MTSGSMPRLLLRCSAAARRADLPSATLRVWERRYGVVGPGRSAGGQRLYTEEDVQRLKLLKRVVDRGYAIGTVARLWNDQLAQLAMAADFTESHKAAPPQLKWAIVGQALKERLTPVAFAMRDHAYYESIATAMSTLEPGSANIIIVHSPSLHEETSSLLADMALRHPGTTLAVIYSFGVAVAVSQLRDAGIRLFREPLGRMQITQALDDLARSSAQIPRRAAETTRERIPRVFAEHELAFIEQRATIIACECPAHLTALIGSLNAFEKYSDECGSSDSREEALHRHIGDVTSQARCLLEKLLHRVTSFNAKQQSTIAMATSA